MLEENNLSHLLEGFSLEPIEYETITFPNGFSIQKSGNEYFMDEDIILTEEQVNFFANPDWDFEPITLTKETTEEDINSILAERYPDIELPDIETIKKTVNEYLESPTTKGAGLVSCLFVNLWNSKEVPYTISNSITDTPRQTIINGIAHWNTKSNITNFRFVPRNGHKDYIEFVYGDKNASPVGKQGGKQQIKLIQGGFNRGTVIHELGHAIGLFHEQSKENRDKHINIHKGNIQSGKEHNFERKTVNCAQFDTFDYGSIMLYDSYDFSKNGQPTLTRKNGTTWTAQRTELSRDDVDIFTKMMDLSFKITYIFLLSGQGGVYIP